MSILIISLPILTEPFPQTEIPEFCFGINCYLLAPITTLSRELPEGKGSRNVIAESAAIAIANLESSDKTSLILCHRPQTLCNKVSLATDNF